MPKSKRTLPRVRPGSREARAAQVLTALAVPMRLQILRHLVRSPQTVSELVGRLPATQSAVSQHLKVLRESELVDADRRGKERVYRAKPQTLAELRRYIDGMWDEALRGFERFAKAQK